MSKKDVGGEFSDDWAIARNREESETLREML